LSLRDRTLFVLGAGSSSDLGFPLGNSLRSRIADVLRFGNDGWNITGGSPRIRSFLMEQESSRRGDLLAAANHVSRNVELSDSIDTYLQSNPDKSIEKVAKLAICDVIAEAENNSKLQTLEAAPDNFDFASLGPFWAKRLFARLHRILEQSETPAAIFENVQFVTFNYDRTLEQFLTLAIGSFYRLSYRDAAAIVARIPIWHVYGSLGRLDLETADRAQFGIPLGSLDQVSDRIRTFSETRSLKKFQS
jgi:hypothetical protein